MPDTDQPLTPEFLKAEIAVCGKATPGPYRLDPHFQCYIWGPKCEMIADDGMDFDDENLRITRMRGVGANLPLKANAELFIHARANYSRVCQALIEAHERIKELEAK